MKVPRRGDPLTKQSTVHRSPGGGGGCNSVSSRYLTKPHDTKCSLSTCPRVPPGTMGLFPPRPGTMVRHTGLAGHACLQYNTSLRSFYLCLSQVRILQATGRFPKPPPNVQMRFFWESENCPNWCGMFSEPDQNSQNSQEKTEIPEKTENCKLREMKRPAHGFPIPFFSLSKAFPPSWAPPGSSYPKSSCPDACRSKVVTVKSFGGGRGTTTKSLPVSSTFFPPLTSRTIFVSGISSSAPQGDAHRYTIFLPETRETFRLPLVPGWG